MPGKHEALEFLRRNIRRAARDHGCRVRAQVGHQRRHDLVGDIVLHLEDVGQRPVVPLRPQVGAVRRVDQLRYHTDRVAGTADRAFQYRIHVQRGGDVGDGRVLVLEVERGGAGGHPQAVDLGEQVQQFLREPVAEVLVLLVLAHVDEGQHGDGVEPPIVCLGSRLLRSSRGLRSSSGGRPDSGFVALHRALEQQRADSGRHQADDEVVQLVPGLVGDRLIGLNVPRALDAVRRQLEGPGEQQREREADHAEPDDESQREVGKPHRGRDRVGHLDDDPAQDEVGCAHLEDIAAL